MILSSATRDALSEPLLRLARDQGYARLERLSSPHGDHAEPVVLWGVYGASSVDPMAAPEEWLVGVLDDLATHARRLLDPDVFRPLCVEFGPFGVHFIDRILGTRVYFQDGQWWSTHIEARVGALQAPDLAADPTWAVAERIARAFVASGVTVPVLGLPTISSALNVAVNLYGEAFLIALHAEPDAALRNLATIKELLRTIHAWYRRTVPEDQLQQVVAAQRLQPPGCGQVCGCSTALVSAKTYSEAIAPYDAALLADHPRGGMIHLCGAHTQHIAAWSEMRSLRAVQLNDRTAADLGSYLARLRSDQTVYLNPCDEMSVEQALAVSGGRRLVIVADGIDQEARP